MIEMLELRLNGETVGYRVIEEGRKAIDIGVAYEKGEEGSNLKELLEEYQKRKGKLRRDYLVGREGGEKYITEEEEYGEEIEDRTYDAGLGVYLREVKEKVSKLKK